MPEKILIVDGDPSTVTWLKTKIEQAGFATHTANRGDRALQMLGSEEPDLLVLDITLPDMDGRELIRRVRADQSSQGISIIVLSSRVQAEDIAASLNAGADHYIVKRPGADVELIAKMRAQFSLPRKAAPTAASVSPPPSRGRVFSFISGKGGTGSTSVCVNTAYALAKVAPQGTEILVVDMVFPMGTVTQFLGIETPKTIVGLTAEASNGIDETLVDKYVSQPLRWGYRVLAGSRDPQEASRLDVSMLPPLLQCIKSMYDLILVDLGRMHARASLPVLHTSADIIVIATPDISTVRATRVAVEHLESQGVDRDRMLLVNNRTVGRVWTTTEDIEREVKLPLRVTIPYTVEYMTMAINEAVPFMAKFPEHAASLEFRDLARLILEGSRSKTRDRVNPTTPSDHR